MDQQQVVVLLTATHIPRGLTQILFCKESMDISDPYLFPFIINILKTNHPTLDSDGWSISAEVGPQPSVASALEIVTVVELSEAAPSGGVEAVCVGDDGGDNHDWGCEPSNSSLTDVNGNEEPVKQDLNSPFKKKIMLSPSMRAITPVKSPQYRPAVPRRKLPVGKMPLEQCQEGNALKSDHHGDLQDLKCDVLISNIISYDKRTFSIFLEKLIKKKGVDLKGTAYTIGDFDELMDQLVVTFENEQIADDVCQYLNGEEFLFEEIKLCKMQHVRVGETIHVAPCLGVAFHGINCYDKKTFAIFLEKLIKKKGVDLQGTAYTIGDYDELMDQLVVTFENEPIADDVCQYLNGEEFLFEEMKLCKIHVPVGTDIPPPFLENFNGSKERAESPAIICSQSSIVENPQQWPRPSADKMATNRVLVYGLPENFDNYTLLSELNGLLWKAGKINKTVKAAVRVVTKNSYQATVEFISILSAAEICKLPGVQYKGRLLVIEHVEDSFSPDDNKLTGMSSWGSMLNFDDLKIGEEPTEDEVKKHDSLKNSHFVIVKNIPPNVKKDDFEKFLIKTMVECGDILDDDNGAIEECILHPSGESLTVKFSCSEQAFLAAQLEVEYESRLLVIKQTIMDRNVGDEYYLSEDEEEESNRYVSIDSDRGAEVFLKLLIRYRDDFPKAGSFDPLLNEIREVLDVFNVCGTVEQLRKKRAALKNQYRLNLRKAHSSHKWFIAESVAFDSKPKSLLIGSKFEWTQTDEDLLNVPSGVEEDKNVQDLIRFSEAASWTNRSTLALVQACLEHKEEYDRATRRPQFWRQISNFLFTQKLVYGPEKCAAKMKELQTEYLDYCGKAEQTGAEGPMEMVKNATTREIMAVMHELKWTDVTVNPKRVLAAGVKVFCREPKDDVLLAQKDDCKIKGRPRPTVLKREKVLSPSERRIAIEEKKAEAEIGKAAALKAIGEALMKKKKVIVRSALKVFVIPP